MALGPGPRLDHTLSMSGELISTSGVADGWAKKTLSTSAAASRRESLNSGSPHGAVLYTCADTWACSLLFGARA